MIPYHTAGMAAYLGAKKISHLTKLHAISGVAGTGSSSKPNLVCYRRRSLDILELSYDETRDNERNR
jgi:hypothetical protein